MRTLTELRRTVAQFLNGVAVAILVAVLVVPLSAGAPFVPGMLVGVVSSLAVHGLAVIISSLRGK